MSIRVELTHQMLDRTEAIERDMLAQLRRGSHDSQSFTIAPVGMGAIERLRDTSVENIPHETVIDPAQDNAGSQLELQ